MGFMAKISYKRPAFQMMSLSLDSTSTELDKFQRVTFEVPDTAGAGHVVDMSKCISKGRSIMGDGKCR